MTKFEEIIKSAQWNQSIQDNLGLSSQISKMIKSRENNTKGLSGIRMLAELAKNLQEQHGMFEKPALSEIQKMAKGLMLQPTYTIPQATINAITAISRQHEKLFGGLRAMTDALKNQSSALAQINNLNFALSGISGQIAALAAHKKNWTIIDDFEEVTGQALGFSESLNDEITEEQKKQFQVLLSLIFAFINKHKQKGIYAFRFLEVVLVFYSYYSIFLPKPELAEKLDIRHINIKQDTLIHYINLVNEQLKEAKEYRITNRFCEIKLKPKSKSLILSKLPKNFEVIVIQIHHKWVYVSYFDPKDNLPQTGWIMKKYLEKPE